MSDFIVRLRKLDLPPKEFVVIGSGLLDVLKLRDANDVDIVVSEHLFKNLQMQGWEPHQGYGETYLVSGDCEAWLSWDNQDDTPNFNELFNDNNVIDGFHFISLDRLLTWKLARARPKDLIDAELIKNHIGKLN